MYKVLLSIVGLICSLVTYSAFAVIEDNSLIDLEATQQVKLNQTFTLQSFKSCQDFESVMRQFILTLHKYQRFGGYRGGVMPLMAQDGMATSAPVANAVKTSESATADKTQSAQGGYWGEFSQTNTQKVGVDEPEIIKTDGDYIYYYSSVSVDYNKSSRGKIAIFKAGSTMAQTDLLKVINLPRSFRNVQMFLQDDKLILIAQRYLNTAAPRESYEPYFIDKSRKTTVIVYDVSDPLTSKVLKIVDYDGDYVDARIVGSTLIVASQALLSRGPIYPLLAQDNTLDMAKLDFTVSKMIPMGLTIDYTTDPTLKNIKKGEKIVNYHGAVVTPDCDDVMYVMPSEDAIKNHQINHPEFSILHTLNLSDLSQKPQTKVLFGSTSQIHVSTQGIYLTSNLYLGGVGSWSCPTGGKCLMRDFPQSENTLVHKLAIGSQLNYINSVIVPGQPLNQYSMDEDASGKFRILTKTRSPTLATHLYILGSDLSLLGSLKDIEPGEEFKSSRYIGDKLYLVTFKQIDPLFAIDLAQTNNPKIIGELKIPGFSTYLHPYAPASQGTQYLIGLGYDTEINQRGGETTKGVKIDLYKIDYNTLNASGTVNIRQVATQTLGGKGSYCPALDNPRSLVWNEKTKQLILPLVLSYEKQTQQCNIQYDTDGKELNKQCYPMTNFVSSFAGIKGLKIDIESGISENFSVDYLDKLKSKFSTQYGGFQSYDFNKIDPRVGYIGDRYYLINRYFGHFFSTSDSKGKYIDIR